ncbi:hipl1 protein [Phtheirospermum japonicum]|uniref:Hipl1 protein n=1 Tax=Phtheirospermum japonicum TaxID=374723 RepID=A0A830CEP0_9LAMI|nr:hipl1 protein [Phtheirospermum japonicum]
MGGKGNHFVKIIHLLILLQFLDSYIAMPLCTDSRAPLTTRSRLQFCPYNGTSCCNNTDDLSLKQQFESMNISEPSCASLLKSILCARCDPFSAELFRVDTVPRDLPVLYNESICFAGSPVTLNNTPNPTPPNGMCLEKIGNGTYLNMVAHPDGSGRAFFSNQQGKIFLATIPKQGSGGILEIDESDPFLDITDEVQFDTQFGMLGIAFHPKFAENGRFFASFNCDKAKWAECAGRCACNSDVDCDPSKIGPDNGDPYNFAQNKKSLLGKIMRFDVDNMPSAAEVGQLGLWGNYSIPKDNPYTIDKDLQKEIWALGLRNPWRCSFDSARPSYFICADTGQDVYEEVDLITKQGNYGWRVFEGPYPYTPAQSPGGNSSVGPINPIFPVLGYNHSEVNTNEGSASITGGYFYRSMTDPCMYGRYLFADLYADAIWSGAENPINSGKFTSNKVSFNCARDSPVSCTFTPGSSLPALSYIFSFGEDNDKDVYLLTNSGVYRIVRPSRCNYTCSKQNASSVASPGPAAGPAPSEASLLRDSFGILLVQLHSIKATPFITLSMSMSDLEKDR